MKDFKLEEHPKIESGFITPEHYFETVTAKINEQLLHQKPKVIPLFNRKKTWITVAAAVLIMALFVPIYNTIKPQETIIDSASIENYLTYQSNISQFDLVNLLDDSDVEAIDLDILVEDNTIEEILSTNSNFENYLID
jgi:hypothetical protein